MTSHIVHERRSLAKPWPSPTSGCTQTLYVIDHESPSGQVAFRR